MTTTRTRRMQRALHRPRLGWAALGTGVLAVGYSPTSRVPIIADDFQAIQETYAVSDGSLVDAVRFGLEQGTLAGHFNPAGQAFGAAWHWSVYGVSARLNADPQNLDVLGGLLLLWAAVATAVAVVHSGLSRGAGDRAVPGFWPLFAVAAAATGATLQIHAPWTNDPVVSYGPAGFGSAVLGFGLLALVLRAAGPAARWPPLLAATVLALVCVSYYEMLVAAIVAVATVLGLLLLTARGPTARAERIRCVVLLATTVALPALLFVGSRTLAEPQSDTSYDGTAVSLGRDALETWTTGMLGALPTSAWGFVEERTGVRLTVTALLVALALCLGISVIVLLLRTRRYELPASRRPVLVGFAGLLVFWALATASHSVTRKYIDEIQEVGHVYLFYAVGVVVVAVLLAIVLMLVAQGRRGSLVLLALGPLLGVLLLAQVAVNLTVAREVREVTYPWNGPLAALSVEPDSDPLLRCDVLAAWRDGNWPDYYRTAVSDGLQENFKRVYGTDFCPPDLAREREIPQPSEP